MSRSTPEDTPYLAAYLFSTDEQTFAEMTLCYMTERAMGKTAEEAHQVAMALLDDEQIRSAIHSLVAKIEDAKK